ncbi:MAG TPA: hypothetical protein VJQ54_14605 [Candidatus Sulfotelmatobacter sp.]|nr:hypothetical protein [Candidatus Sulfotelmatobacter sp.]
MKLASSAALEMTVHTDINNEDFKHSLFINVDFALTTTRVEASFTRTSGIFA